jgi:hypothetical protein
MSSNEGKRGPTAGFPPSHDTVSNSVLRPHTLLDPARPAGEARSLPATFVFFVFVFDTLMFSNVCSNIVFDTNDILVSSRISAKRPDTQHTLIATRPTSSCHICQKLDYKPASCSFFGPDVKQIRIFLQAPQPITRRVLRGSACFVAIVLPRSRFFALTSPMTDH